MSFEDQLRRDLHGIELPEHLGPRPDLADMVLAASRSQARRRSLVAAGAAVVVLAVGGASAPLVLSPDPGPAPVASTPPACDGPSPSRAASPTLEHFDLLTYRIDASAVSGYAVTGRVTSTYFQGLALVNPTGDRSVWVVLFAGGGEPHYADPNRVAVPFDPAAGAPAGQVGGAPAYWLPDERIIDAPKGQQGIAWQWAPGAWVFVIAGDRTPEPTRTTPVGDSPSTVEPQELRALASQAAHQIRLGIVTPVTSPFAMPVPDCTRLSTVGVEYGTQDGEPYTDVLLGFDTADRPDRTFPPVGSFAPSLVVWARTGTTLAQRSPGMAPYPGELGFPAYQTEDGQLEVVDVYGLGIDIWPISMPDAATPQERVRLAVDVFRTISCYPGAAGSPDSWGPPIVP